MKANPYKFIHTFEALAGIGQEIANRHSFNEMIRVSLHLLLGSLAIMRGGIARYLPKEHEFQFIAVRNLGDDFPLSIPISMEDERDLTCAGLRGIEADQAKLLCFFQQNYSIFEKKKIELIVPLIVRSELVGVILLGEKASGEPYDSTDLDVICAISRHIGVGIHQRNIMIELERKAEENRKLYENLQVTYKDTIKAFAAAIDSKDKYTEGHSERVGKYTEIIAEELGWDEKCCEGAAVAGYLHDVGKLVVDRSIINAPYRINARESAELSKHPSIGYEILLPIHHPFVDVPLAAKYHHERVDGRGYPEGLSGDQIPFIARIVNLADSFDAMTTDRPYKHRRSFEEVIEDLRRNAGKQFDPSLVVAFCNAMLNEFSGETNKKRFSRLLGKGYVNTSLAVPLLRKILNDLDGTSGMTFIAS
ncbi:MAG: HD-GYP domain-containing protein [Pyrinomonadaceae bacterium]|nr:HD-GYP domain-containing protein [Pyrinomonadaceae bacterium]MCX7638963.1 HD-GYP domain-containing protein [Pyrinomonadaceae bacterium]MDW8304900.1 HD-GYP domain-containing protein [Acidobacteriota bacterium]